MATKLARLSELFKPKSGDEQKFVAKHVVAKHDDVNGNKDDVFQATNVKTVERQKTRHGYEPGKDEEVYEEVEQVDEKLDASATAGDYVRDFKKSDAPQFQGKSMKKRRQMAIAAYLSNKNMKEEAEQIDELSDKTLKSYVKTAASQAHQRYMADLLGKPAPKGIKDKDRRKATQRAAEKMKEDVDLEEEQLDELKKSTIRSYANKKQAELSDVPAYPFKKKPMTRQQHANAARGMMGALQRLSGRKPTSEEVDLEEEQLDELKKSTLMRYASKATKSSIGMGIKASRARDEDDMETWAKNRNKAERRDRNVQRAMGKIRGEEVEQVEGEQLDELSSDTLRRYMTKARKDITKNTAHLGDAPAGSKRLARINKRVKGFRQAWKKAEDKENMGEEYSTGLLELYANLSDENRADMLEMFENDRETLLSFVDQITAEGKE